MTGVTSRSIAARKPSRSVLLSLSMRYLLLAVLLVGCGGDKITDFCTKQSPCYVPPGPSNAKIHGGTPGPTPDAGSDGSGDGDGDADTT